MLPPTVRSTSPSSRTCSNTCSRLWWIGQTIPTLTADNYLSTPSPTSRKSSAPLGSVPVCTVKVCLLSCREGSCFRSMSLAASWDTCAHDGVTHSVHNIIVTTVTVTICWPCPAAGWSPGCRGGRCGSCRAASAPSSSPPAGQSAEYLISAVHD